MDISLYQGIDQFGKGRSHWRTTLTRRGQWTA